MVIELLGACRACSCSTQVVALHADSCESSSYLCVASPFVQKHDNFHCSCVASSFVRTLPILV